MNTLTLSRVQFVVAQAYGLHPDRFRERCRRRSVAIPRHVAMHLCRQVTTKSAHEIGEAFGLNHTMVSYADKAVERITATDRTHAEKIEGLRKRLMGESA